MESDEYALSLIAQYLDSKVDNEGFPFPLDVSISGCHLFVTILFISGFRRTETV